VERCYSLQPTASLRSYRGYCLDRTTPAPLLPLLPKILEISKLLYLNLQPHSQNYSSPNNRLPTMARGLRSSRLKANNTKLRTNVFSPIEDARMARLSKKQTDLAASATALPRMEVDTTIPAPEETSKAEDPKDEGMSPKWFIVPGPNTTVTPRSAQLPRARFDCPYKSAATRHTLLPKEYSCVLPQQQQTWKRSEVVRRKRAWKRFENVKLRDAIRRHGQLQLKSGGHFDIPLTFKDFALKMKGVRVTGASTKEQRELFFMTLGLTGANGLDINTDDIFPMDPNLYT